MRKFEKLHFLKLVLAENSARIFSRGAGCRAEASGPRRDMNGKLVLGNSFVAIEIVELDFGRRRKPEVAVFHLEKIPRKFWQLSGAHERRSVPEKWRKDLRVTVLASVHVKKEIRQCAFEPRAPAFVNCKS